MQKLKTADMDLLAYLLFFLFRFSCQDDNGDSNYTTYYPREVISIDKIPFDRHCFLPANITAIIAKKVAIAKPKIIVSI